MQLPTIQLQRDSMPGQIIFNIEINPQGLLGQHTSLGTVLRIPVITKTLTNSHLLNLQGWLGFPNENGGLQIPLQTFGQYDQYLDVPVTDEQLARLEEKRAGQQLQIEIRLRGLAAIGDTLATVGSSHAPTITVSRDDWMRILEQLDMGRRRLVELPAPPTRSGLWAVVPEHLQRATWRLAGGDLGGSMSESRTASERLIEAIGADVARSRAPADKAVFNYANAVADVIAGAHRDRSGDPYQILADSVRLVYQTFAFASDTHNGLAHVERLNAESALSMLTTLYSYAAQAQLTSLARVPVATESS